MDRNDQMVVPVHRQGAYHSGTHTVTVTHTRTQHTLMHALLAHTHTPLQIPFGWSFLSIAKVPMTWLQGDVWQAEVMLPAGQRIEYKYVILEEQVGGG